MPSDSEESVEPIRQHPIDERAILVCTSDVERIAPVVMVADRLLDIDTRYYEYGLVDGTNTNRWQYHQDDIVDLFVDTGIRVTGTTKFVLEREARELLAKRCDHHWTEVHDPDTHEVSGEQCLKCREYREEVPADA